MTPVPVPPKSQWNPERKCYETKAPDEAIPCYVLRIQYAIGQQIITQAQVDALRSRYETQSQLATGLFFPTILLIIALATTVRTHVSCWIYASLFFFAVLALATGIHRRHKYYSEVRKLIRSSYAQKIENQKKENERAAKAAAAGEAAQKQARTMLEDIRRDLAKLSDMVQNQLRAPVTIYNQSPAPTAPAPSTETPR